MSVVYDRDGITVICGDTRLELPKMADGSVDAILTDPPYGIGINYGEGSDDKAFLTDWIAECLRVSAGPVVFTIPSTRLYDIPKPDWVGVWNKPLTMGFFSTPYIPHWEAIVFYRPPKKTGRSDVWTFNPVKPNGHPTPKPLELWRSILATLDGETVLDPFCGSGTTLRAAKDLGWKAIGIDVEMKYCQMTADRMAQEVLL